MAFVCVNSLVPLVTSQILIAKHSWALRIAADTDLALAMAFALMGLQTSLDNRNLGRCMIDGSPSVTTRHDSSSILYTIYLYATADSIDGTWWYSWCGVLGTGALICFPLTVPCCARPTFNLYGHGQARRFGHTTQSLNAGQSQPLRTAAVHGVLCAVLKMARQRLEQPASMWGEDLNSESLSVQVHVMPALAWLSWLQW